MFDAGISAMSAVLASACARLGGIKRVVLGHADADHRGAAGALGAPIYCHPAERAAAESPSSVRDYWDLDKLAPFARPIYPWLLRSWDGGAVTIEGTVQEGDEIAGFKVVELPGHAPGLIGLFREEDRLALVSDCIYTLDPQTGIKGATQGSASGVRSRCRSGQGVDPQAGRTGPERRLGRTCQAGRRRRRQ